jgi:hypothetical protein
MVPWIERPAIDVDLAEPIGQRYADVPQQAVAEARQLLAAVIDTVPPAARLLAHLVRARTANRFHQEAAGLARQVGADWRDLMIANISYDLLLATFGCSTLALPTPSGPVVARNMDWWPEALLARASYLMRYTRNRALQFASAGWPGAIGVVTGLSGRGFAVVLNAVASPEGLCKTGYPVLLHIRRVLEDAPDFEAALGLLANQRLAVSALLTLVGRENAERVVIERTPTRHALRWPRGDEPLVATNDYRLLFQPEAHAGAEIYQTTCARYEALCQFFADHRPEQEIDDAALLYILSDPRVIQGITAQHIILRPRTGQCRLFVPRRLVQGD